MMSFLKSRKLIGDAEIRSHWGIENLSRQILLLKGLHFGDKIILVQIAGLASFSYSRIIFIFNFGVVY